jgi:hypothetical protein
MRGYRVLQVHASEVERDLAGVLRKLAEGVNESVAASGAGE